MTEMAGESLKPAEFLSPYEVGIGFSWADVDAVEEAGHLSRNVERAVRCTS